MSLKKNQYGVYELCEVVEFFNPTHRKEMLRLSTGCRSLKDTVDGIGAQTWRARYIKKLQEEDALNVSTKETMHIYEGIKSFMEEDSHLKVKNPEDNESLYRRLTGQFKQHPALPNVLTKDLTAKHMYTLRSQRVRAGLAASTINKEIYLISGALDWLADTQDIEVPKIVWKKLRLKPFKKKRWATWEQLKEILLAIKSDDYRDLAILLMETGARSSEIRKLRWSQFIDNEGVLLIERPKVEDTEHGEAALDLTDRCCEILRRRYRDRQRDEWESEWVFQSRRIKNQPISDVRSIQSAIDRVGLNDNKQLVKQKGKFTLHSLRDSYASNLVKSGKVELYDLQKILGHTTPTMTQKYAHLKPNEASKKAKAVLDSDGLLSRAS